MDKRRSTRTRPVCPECGSDSVIPIMYGYPSAKGFEAAERGEVALGGGVVSDESPEWECQTCHIWFGSRVKRATDEASRD